MSVPEGLFRRLGRGQTAMEIEDIACGFAEEVDHAAVPFVREEVVLLGL